MYPAILPFLRPWRWDPVMTTCCIVAGAVIHLWRNQPHLSRMVTLQNLKCHVDKKISDSLSPDHVFFCPLIITVYQDCSYRGSDSSPTTPECCKASGGAGRTADTPQQASVGSSPSSVRSPLLRQRRLSAMRMSLATMKPSLKRTVALSVAAFAGSRMVATTTKRKTLVL